jgi:predicted O-methyltransferase YrrM
MDSKVQAVLDHYDQRVAAEAISMDQLSVEDITRRIDEFLISIGPDAGTLINILIKAMRSPTVVELGTSYGHSTVFFAEAARASARRVISIDINAEKQQYARGQLAAAGLESFVEFCAGDARDILRALRGPLDFVLIDLWKDLYIHIELPRKR